MKPSESFEQKSEAEMSGDVVVQLMQLFDQNSIDVVVDGGWGVDALLGEQTRSHGDLDIAVEQKDVAVLRRFLEERGYREIKLEIARPWNFVLSDASGREIDVHVIVVD